MRLLSLLFDPRGAIDRRAFWSGLLQLAVVSVAVCTGLGHVGAQGAMAVLPVVGEASAISELAGRASDASALDAPLLLTMLIVAARLYATACLCLKRLRDTGRGPGPLVAMGVLSLVVHLAMAVWIYDLWDREMAVIIPLYADIALTALPWTIFVAWLGATGGRRVAAGAWA